MTEQKTENFKIIKSFDTIITIKQFKPLPEHQDFINALETIPPLNVKIANFIELDEEEILINTDSEEEQIGYNFETTYQAKTEEERDILFNKLAESINEIENIIKYEL